MEKKECKEGHFLIYIYWTAFFFLTSRGLLLFIYRYWTAFFLTSRGLLLFGCNFMTYVVILMILRSV